MWNETHIPPSEFNKLMIPRTCFCMHVKSQVLENVNNLVFGLYIHIQDHFKMLGSFNFEFHHWVTKY